MSNLMTKQGVRNLDVIYGRVKSRPVDLPPASFMCKHKSVRTTTSLYESTVCNDCGAEWVDGKLESLGGDFDDDSFDDMSETA